MKSAIYWLKFAAHTMPASIAETNCEQHEACQCNRCKNGREIFLLPEDIKIIQLDAFKAGMRKAAEIVNERSGMQQLTPTAILTAADNLKELPYE